MALEVYAVSRLFWIIKVYIDQLQTPLPLIVITYLDSQCRENRKKKGLPIPEVETISEATSSFSATP
jgi:hypothetical protein